MYRRFLFLVFVMFFFTVSCSSVSYRRQKLSLEGVSNARQLGGYRIGDRYIVKDVLLRSGNLADATDGDIEALRDRYCVSEVFDFRSGTERDQAPDRAIPGAEYSHLPCLESLMASVSSGLGDASSAGSVDLRHAGSDKFSAGSLEILKSEKVRFLADSLYPMIVFDTLAQQNYARFLDCLAELPEGRSALWHCSQGKDRAGWASAFLLAALGADRQLLVDDFALSNHGYRLKLKAAVAYARTHGMTDEDINVIYALLGVSARNFESTLDMIEARYGSLDGYLEKALDCNASKRARLRERFLK